MLLGMSNWDSSICELILELLTIVLRYNIFLFKDNFYVQKQGTDIGVACALSSAKHFLRYWERDGAHVVRCLNYNR